MSLSPEAQLEYTKMQLIGSLNAVASSMRDCANIADNFSHLMGGVPYLGIGNAGAFPLANGQYGMPILTPMGQDEGGKKRKSRSDDTEGKRKVKKPKDPLAPKRPASSYLLFQNDVRNELKAKNPGLPNNELLSAISKLWSEMPKDQKDAYETRNKQLKERWQEEKKAYESSRTEVSPAGGAIAPPGKVSPITPIAADTCVPSPKESSASSESSSEAEEDDDDDDDDDEDEEVVVETPAPKKSKKEPIVQVVKDIAPAPKKERKHKKTKA